MEYSRLCSFYLGVKAWPKTDLELELIAEKIATLFNAYFCAVLIYPWAQSSKEIEQSKTAIRYLGVEAGERIATPVLEDFIKKKIQGFDAVETFGYLKQMSLVRESIEDLALVDRPGLGSLAFIPIQSIGRHSPCFGWFVIGTAKSLTPLEESLAIAVAQRLSELGVVQKLESEIDVRNQFLSIVSHELKTPLTSIYGILQLQERMMRLRPESEIGVSDQKKSYLKILLRQVERLNELIDGLLDISRIQNGRFIVEPTEVEVCHLVREAVQGRLQIIADEAGVKLSLDLPEKVLARVDPVRMEEVVTNLVMNAIRFSPEGGVVWIKLREDAGHFRLTIRDQGPSVPIEDRERLFQPFERAQRTSRLGGLGLGLFISRQIALLHGGNVSLIESVPGKGNVIEAYFPINQLPFTCV